MRQGLVKTISVMLRAAVVVASALIVISRGGGVPF
jgi:hypothetical protein